MDRLVEEAAARHDPDELTRRTQAAADRRGVHLDTTRTSLAGTVPLHGELDLPDALALDEALAQGAADLASLGNTEPLDARRATALGDLARAQLPLDLLTAGTTVEGSSVEPVETTTTRPTPARKPKQVVLHLHLSDAALGSGPGTEPLGRVGTTHTPVTAETIRTWCGQADSLVIKPVIDLNHQISVHAYEVPDRIREHIALRDHTCVFPWCTRAAEQLRHRPRPTLRVRWRDLDGQPRPAVPGPPPRQDPRPAGHLTVLSPGTYLWRSPHGLHLLRDHTGTQTDRHRGLDELDRRRTLTTPPHTPPH